MKRALILIQAIGKTDRQIEMSRKFLLKYTATRQLEPIEIDQDKLDGEFADLNEQIHHSYPLYSVSYALRLMSSCDTVIFGKGWERRREFILAHAVAVAYGLEVIYEEKIENERINQQHENKTTKCDQEGFRHRERPACRQSIHP